MALLVNLSILFLRKIILIWDIIVLLELYFHILNKESNNFLHYILCSTFISVFILYICILFAAEFVIEKDLATARGLFTQVLNLRKGTHQICLIYRQPIFMLNDKIRGFLTRGIVNFGIRLLAFSLRAMKTQSFAKFYWKGTLSSYYAHVTVKSYLDLLLATLVNFHWCNAISRSVERFFYKWFSNAKTNVCRKFYLKLLLPALIILLFMNK